MSDSNEPIPEPKQEDAKPTPPEKPKPDGDAIAEIGDEVGGPA